MGGEEVWDERVFREVKDEEGGCGSERGRGARDKVVVQAEFDEGRKGGEIEGKLFQEVVGGDEDLERGSGCVERLRDGSDLVVFDPEDDQGAHGCDPGVWEDFEVVVCEIEVSEGGERVCERGDGVDVVCGEVERGEGVCPGRGEGGGAEKPWLCERVVGERE